MPKVMEQVTKFEQPVSGAYFDDICDCGGIVREVFGEKAELRSWVAFPYLWRRFGPSSHGCDGLKELACYYLTTKDPEIFLAFSLNSGSLYSSLGYVATKTLREAARQQIWAPMQRWERRFDRWWMEQHPEYDFENQESWSEKLKSEVGNLYWHQMYSDPEWKEKARKAIGPWPKRRHASDGWRKFQGPIRRINEGFYAAVRELLRPVHIRDAPLNVFGEAKGNRMKPAARSKYAGLGVPQEPLEQLRRTG